MDKQHAQDLTRRQGPAHAPAMTDTLEPRLGMAPRGITRVTTVMVKQRAKDLARQQGLEHAHTMWVSWERLLGHLALLGTIHAMMTLGKLHVQALVKHLAPALVGAPFITKDVLRGHLQPLGITHAFSTATQDVYSVYSTSKRQTNI
jgi:hypothetical protein